MTELAAHARHRVERLRLRSGVLAAMRRTNRFPDTQDTEDPGDPATYRAMDLALRVGELLLASGETTENVSEAMQSLSVAYGLPRSEAAVTFTAISLSCLPGKGSAPVTGERIVRRRSPNYDRLAATHALVREASMGAVDLDDAFDRLGRIKHDAGPYPAWLLALALPLVSASAAVLTGGGAAIALIAFLGTVLADQTTRYLARRGVAEFYQLAIAAAIGSATTVPLVAVFPHVRGSAVVIGTIMALLPGRPLVASVLDGITGSFVSSTARMVEAFYSVIALVAGVGITVYLAVQLHVSLPVDGVSLTAPALGPLQLGAAVAISVTFALSLVVPIRAVVSAGIGGGLIWTVYVLLCDHGIATVPAAAIAAACIGTVAHVVAHRHQAPSLPYIVPIIGPLLPGTAMYRGLLDISNGQMSGGAISLVQAVAIAFALAGGLSVGSEVVRAFGGGLTTGVGPKRRPAARRTHGQ